MKYKALHPIIPNDERVLATFWQRALAISIDLIIVILICVTIIVLCNLFGVNLKLFEVNIQLGKTDSDQAINLIKEDQNNLVKRIIMGFIKISPTLYFTLLNYFTNGRTPGKRIMHIRIVSIYHQRISFWHCVERALGYAASTLELGLGFLQIFLEP